MFYSAHEKSVWIQFKTDIKNYINVSGLEAALLLISCFSISALNHHFERYNSLFLSFSFSVLLIYATACFLKSFVKSTSVDKHLFHHKISHAEPYKFLFNNWKLLFGILLVIDVVLVMSGETRMSPEIATEPLFTSENYEKFGGMSSILSLALASLVIGGCVSLFSGAIYTPLILVVFTMLRNVSSDKIVDAVHGGEEGMSKILEEFSLICCSIWFGIKKNVVTSFLFIYLVTACDLSLMLQLDFQIVLNITMIVQSFLIAFYGFYFYARTLQLRRNG